MRLRYAVCLREIFLYALDHKICPGALKRFLLSRCVVLKDYVKHRIICFSIERLGFHRRSEPRICWDILRLLSSPEILVVKADN